MLVRMADRVRDTSPKTTLPKRHFAETTLCRMRHFAEILPKFGKNAEKDVIKSTLYNVIFHNLYLNQQLTIKFV